MSITLNSYHKAVGHNLAVTLIHCVTEDYNNWGAQDSDKNDYSGLTEYGERIFFPCDVSDVMSSHIEGLADSDELEEFSDDYASEIVYYAAREVEQAMDMCQIDFECYDEDGNVVSAYDEDTYDFKPSAFDQLLAEVEMVVEHQNYEVQSATGRMDDVIAGDVEW